MRVTKPITAPQAVLTIAEFMATYRIGLTKTYQLLRSGTLRARKSGSQTLIPAAEAERWLNSLPEYEIGRTHARPGRMKADEARAARLAKGAAAATVSP